MTNLGPDSGGRLPGQGRVKVYSWEWGPDESRRPGLPWIAIFLVVFGGLLLIQQAYPEARRAGSAFVLALGLAFLIKWAIDRGTGSLYAGAIITALAAPGVLNAAGVDVDGLGHLLLRRRVPVHRRGPRVQRRRARLAALVRRAAGADRRREHGQPGRRRADPADPASSASARPS